MYRRIHPFNREYHSDSDVPTPRELIKSITNQIYDFPKIFFKHTGLIKHSPTIYSEYFHLEKRIRTLNSWPKNDIVKSEDMAASGFFYMGVSDVVTCHHCGITLANWESGDNVDEQHFRYNKHCTFLHFKRKNHTNNSELTCKVCLDTKCHYAIAPCGHLQVCHNCLLYCKKCPICKIKINGLLQIYV